MKRILCLLLALVLLLSGCKVLNTPGDTTTAPTQSEDPGLKPTGSNKPNDPQPTQPQATEPLLPEDTDGVIDIGVDRLPCSEEELYNQLFDPNAKVEINIDMSDEELNKLQEDYEHYRGFNSKSPIYRMADVVITVNGTPYRMREVGVRMKGNTSRTSFYSPEEGIYKAIHLKLDFQETFEEPEYYGSNAKNWTDKEAKKARKDRTFATLEQLEMRWNKCYDSTYLKETYSYELYRSHGVLAPLTNLCSFDWSGVHMGVYTINEPVDKVFLEKRLDPADLGGDLYKCGWTWEPCTFTNMNSIGIEDEDKGEFYCFDLKTNKKTSDHSTLKNLIRQLNAGDMTREKFEQLVDVESFINYAAVSYFLGNPDDLRNNYNNFYLYFLQSSGKAVIIPYDYDRSLGVTAEYNPSGHGMTSDNPFSDIREGAQNKGDKQENPLFLYTVVKGGYYVRQYADALTRVSRDDLLKPETFKQWFDRAEGLYGNAVQPSKTLKNMEGRDLEFDLYRTSAFDSQGNISYEQYIIAKMSCFNVHMAKLDEYINYERPQPTNYYIRGDFNGWSNHEDYGMKNENGLMTYTLRFSHDFAFKVYNNAEQEWLGVECLPEDTTVEYTTNDHGNIKLKPGTYKVTYNPETKIITLEKL